MKRIVLKVWLPNGKVIQKVFNHRTRRFTSSAVPRLFQKAYVKVSYGRKECNLGCVCEFANWGIYETRLELLKAIRDFSEGDQGNG